MPRPQAITTYLWFNGNAEEAVELYTSIFSNSGVANIGRWGEGGPVPSGAVMTVAFEPCHFPADYLPDPGGRGR
jgi:predicted 3-demethylubiquinone-9 3-methyltransferase (glyoxalase superfamily)